MAISAEPFRVLRFGLIDPALKVRILLSDPTRNNLGLDGAPMLHKDGAGCIGGFRLARNCGGRGPYGALC